MNLKKKLLLITGLIGSIWNSVCAQQVQTPQSIAATAKSFLEHHHNAGQNDVDIQIGGIDPRLRLAPCSQQLQGFIPPNTQLKGNAIVGVRCVGIKSWHIYLPVQIKVTQNVLVFKRSLKKGHVISAQDVTLRKQDIALLRGDPIDNPKAFIGSTLKRNVRSGELAFTHFACMVCKGEKLKIIAKNQRLSVSMEGNALEDGFMGQRVRIKNIGSSKILSGTVIAKNKVAVGI